MMHVNFRTCRCFVATAAVSAAVLLASTQAHAFDLRTFRQSPHSTSYFSVDTGAIADELTVQAGLSVDGLYLPLQLVDPAAGSVVGAVVKHRIDAMASASVAMFGRLSLAVTLPIAVYQDGTSLVSGTRLAASLSDIGLEAKVSLLNGERHHLDLGVLAYVNAPLGRPSQFTSDTSVIVGGDLLIGRNLGPFGIHTAFGAAWRKEQPVYDIRIGPELRSRTGVALHLQHFHLPRISLIAEVFGRASLLHPFERAAETPVEWVAGVRWQPLDWLIVSAGGGRGIIAGYGSPAARWFVSLFFVPFGPSSAPAPAASIPASTPTTLPASEPAQSDSDSSVDANTRTDLDTDGDGVLDSVDLCPLAPEDLDGFQDGDGCADFDNDSDGIADTMDKCPNEEETINNNVDDDGCPDQGVTLVQLEKTEIDIREKVYFQTDQTTVAKRSYPLLAQVARVLINHRNLKLVRIEGHTEKVGTQSYNLQLSQKRADSVRKHLIKVNGIDPARLEAVGRGELKPAASNSKAKGRAVNRRVVFYILEQ